MFWFGCYFSIPLSCTDFSKMTRNKLNKFKNSVMFQNTFARLLQDALNRYHFENLPSTISERVLLQSLVWYGSAVIFEKEGNLYALPGVPSGQGFNVYADFSEGYVFGANGFNEKVKLFLHGSDEGEFLKEEIGTKQKGRIKGVLIRENAILYPFVRQVLYFSQAIADTMRTLDVCRTNLKNPFLITCEESLVNSVKEFFRKRDENNEFVVSSGIFPANSIELLPFTTSSENLNAVSCLIEYYENKFRELCGIDNNSNIDKKGENLIESEVSINDEYTENSVDKCIKYIQESLDDVNKIFGTNIKVVANKKKESDKNDDLFRNDREETDFVREYED